MECQIDPTVYAKLSEEPAAVAASIQAFNAAGIQVWACWNGNNTGWDDDTDGHTWHEFFEAVLNWNKDHPTARFTALQFDLEPSRGSTTEQHKAFLEGVYATMQTMRGFTVDGTENIESQDLPVAMSRPAQVGEWPSALTALSQVVSIVDVWQIDHYRWGDASHSLRHRLLHRD